ncbi:hypothetical protein J6590_090894 [Homalodisca vitripennis]|nr:hypothetical protein J6590_090894 [Homalodisca vitripennis]
MRGQQCAGQTDILSSDSAANTHQGLAYKPLNCYNIIPGQRHNCPGSVVTINATSRLCDIKELSALTLSGWIVRLSRARDKTVLVQLSLTMICHVSVTSKSFRLLHYQRQNRPGSVVTNHDMSRLCDIKELSAPTLSGWIVRLTRARDKTVLVQLSLTMICHVSVTSKSFRLLHYQRQNRPGSVVTNHDMSRLCDIKELSAPTLSGWIVRLTRARDKTVLVQLSLTMPRHVSVTSKSFRLLHYQINPGQRQNRPGSVVTNDATSRLCDIKELSAPTLSGWIVRLTRARDKTVLVQLSLTIPRHVSVTSKSFRLLHYQRQNRPGSVVTNHHMSRLCDIKELSAPTLSGWIVRLTRARDKTVLVQLSLTMPRHVSVTSKSFRLLHYQINPGQRQNRPGSVVTNDATSRLCDIKELSAPTLSGWIVRLTRARDKTVLVQLSLTIPRHVSVTSKSFRLLHYQINPGQRQNRPGSVVTNDATSRLFDIKDRVLIIDSRYNPGHPEPCTRKES